MKIYLPNDADGNVIPSNVKVMYEKDGSVVRVDDVVHGVISKKWRVQSGRDMFKPSQLYLTPPDSWKKLEDDLRKIVNHPKKIVCAYFGRERKDCDGCKLEDCDSSCSHACLEDAIARIHKLRGED